MAKTVSAKAFAEFLKERSRLHDGYIMGSRGEDPRKWSKTSWWFTQYSGSQKTKALYWREHAARVWDCNGMAEGYYEDMTGVNINQRARNNYASWCNPKGTGKIPNKYKVPGAAVFIHNGSYISHVGFLVEPINAAKPEGDWWVVEARGVMYGVVTTKLSARGWNRWGIMSKYYDYEGNETVTSTPTSTSTQLGSRLLKKGKTGADVEELQTLLMSLGYDLGKYGADGDFGSATEKAVMNFQRANGLSADGEYGPLSHAVMVTLIKTDEPDPEDPDTPEEDKPVEGSDEPEDTSDETDEDSDEDKPEGADGQEDPPTEQDKYVFVTGGTVNVRTQPNTSGSIVFVAKKGESFKYTGMTSIDGWHCIVVDGSTCWISGVYSEVKELEDTQTDDPYTPPTVIDDDRAIIDISAYQDIKDAAAAAKVAKNVKLVIHRASVGVNKDTKWVKHAKLMQEAGIAYGVYHYNKAKTLAQARAEAQLLYKQASPYNPIFYVADMEWSGIPNKQARAICSEFIAELRRLGAKKVGIYIGHSLYPIWNLNYDEAEFIWIPRYGDSKTNLAGKHGANEPAYTCTLHQYSSGGSIPGITGRVDMNHIMTGKKAQLTFEQLIERK